MLRYNKHWTNLKENTHVWPDINPSPKTPVDTRPHI